MGSYKHVPTVLMIITVELSTVQASATTAV